MTPQVSVPTRQRTAAPTLAALSVLVLYQAAVLIPFHFGGALGERDAYRMLMGMLDCVHRGVWFDSALLYNRQVSFGYFAVLHEITAAMGSSPQAIIAVMNWMSMAAAVLSVAPFFFVVDRLFGRAEAVIASLLLPAVPVWWQVSRYGHPISPALLLFFSALALTAIRQDSGSRTRRSLLAVAAAGLFAAALTFRLDLLLLFPLIGCTMSGATRWRGPARAAAYMGFAVVIFAAAQAALPPVHSGARPETVMELLRRYEDPALVRAFLRLDCTMVAEAFGAGFLLAMPAAVAILRRNRGTDRQIFFIAYPAAANLLFWMPNPSPPRHYMLLAPAAAVCGAVVLRFVLARFRLSRPVWWWGAGLAGAAVAVVVSLALQWGPARRVPEVVSVFSSYRVLPLRQAAWSRLAGDLVALPPLGRPALVLCDAYYVAARMSLLRPDVRAQLEDQNIQGQRMQLLTVRQGGNTFIMLVQSWESAEVRALDSAGLYADALLIVDPYNREIRYTGPRRPAAVLPAHTS